MRTMVASLAAAGCALGAGAVGAQRTGMAVGDPATTGTARPGPVVFREDWTGAPLRAAPWVDGAAVGRWRVRYTGYGLLRVADDGGLPVLSQAPRVAVGPGADTHASLVTTRQRFGDVDLALSVRTVRQLRRPVPNPWEAAWVVWAYADDRHFYSLVLKPNGWELGKQDPAYPGDQRYLRTGSQPRYAIGRWHRVRVRQVGATVRVEVNDRPLTSCTDRERPYLHGAVGLYDEDAHVHFGPVLVRAARQVSARPGRGRW